MGQQRGMSLLRGKLTRILWFIAYKPLGMIGLIWNSRHNQSEPLAVFVLQDGSLPRCLCEKDLFFSDPFILVHGAASLALSAGLSQGASPLRGQCSSSSLWFVFPHRFSCCTACMFCQWVFLTCPKTLPRSTRGRWDWRAPRCGWLRSFNLAMLPSMMNIETFASCHLSVAQLFGCLYMFVPQHIWDNYR